MNLPSKTNTVLCLMQGLRGRSMTTFKPFQNLLGTSFLAEFALEISPIVYLYII